MIHVSPQPTAEPSASPSSPSSSLTRVALFLADLGGGGAERMMVNLAAGFAERGVAVDLLLANATGAYLDHVPATVQMVDLGCSRSATAVGPLRRYLRRVRPDVLMSTLDHACVVAALAHRTAGGPTRLVLREANTPRRGRGSNAKDFVVLAGVRWAYAQADAVVALSEGAAEGLKRHRGVPDGKIWTLYNPVVTQDLADLARRDPGHPWLVEGAPPVVLGVGSLNPRKGFRTLLTAFARLDPALAARLIVLGEGDQRHELETYAAELGIADRVEFPGFVANPFAYMARAAVYVLASEREGLPGALIQAMACGCPVVATDCESGPAEILENGRHGALIPVGDPSAMTEAIERTLRASTDASSVVARASRFAAERVVAAHLEAFESIVATRAAR